LNYFLGATPIVPVLRQVLQDKRNHIYERNLLILIATDGVPTDERERTDTHTLEHVLRNERKPINQIPVTIIVCTGRLKRSEQILSLQTDRCLVIHFRR
jgi:Mg-chelatase subunit ChlD